MKIWIKKKRKQYTLLVSTGQMNDGIVPALLMYQLMRVEREVGALIFGSTYLVTSTVFGSSLGMP